MEKRKRKLSDIILDQIAQVQQIGFVQANPDLRSNVDLISSYFEKQADLKQLHSVAFYFVDSKNKSILEQRPRDAMLYDVLAYLVSCIECSVDEDKTQCMQYLKAAQQVLIEAKNFED